MHESTLFCILSVSWVSTRVDKSGAPKLKGARLFTLSELKRATHSFHKSREIGAGGYGKVPMNQNALPCFINLGQLFILLMLRYTKVCCPQAKRSL